VLRYTPNLAAIVLALVALRVAGVVIYAVMCGRAVHRPGPPIPVDRNAARQLLGFGAWMTVSNIVSPLMVSVDRFFVGAMLSIAAVAYYATPFEAVTKLLIIPSAITAVLFPAFSTASHVDRARMAELFRAGVWAISLSMYPIAFVVITFAPELLHAWLGATFSAQSANALRWLALGVFMNSLASLPFALLQGVGRSDTTAKIHLAEAPIYLILMVWLIRQHGITGAAVAWCARTTLDMILLYWCAVPYLRDRVAEWRRDLAVPAALIPALGAGLLAESPTQKLWLAGMLVALFVVVAWQWTVASGRRAWIGRLLGSG